MEYYYSTTKTICRKYLIYFAYIALQHAPEKRRKEPIRTIRLETGR